MGKIKVLIVDDSAVVRDVLTEKLSLYNDIEVVGTAPDPFIARNKILSLNPDIITLDIEMPKMDGLTFLEKLMTYYPIPIIIVSSVTTKDPHASIKALEIGAFDVVNKPGGSISVKEVVEEIYFKIKQAYQIKDSFVTRRKIVDGAISKKIVSFDKNILRNVITTDKLIAIGSSTGGTVALEFIFKHLPANLPPVLVVQHMPEGYTKQFAERLNDFSDLTIKEAENGEILSNGIVYIARGGNHLVIERRGANIYTRLTVTDRIQYQRPSVDVLFESVAEIAGKNSLGILLTGMGKDGADGLLKMKNNGALTICQDEESSVVWGMPKAAIDIGAAVEIINLSNVPDKIVNYSK